MDRVPPHPHLYCIVRRLGLNTPTRECDSIKAMPKAAFREYKGARTMMMSLYTLETSFALCPTYYRAISLH